MRSNILPRFAFGAIALSAIVVAPALTTTTFAQDAPAAITETAASTTADATSAMPASIQIAPASANIAIPRAGEAGNPFDFAPAGQQPLQDQGAEACGTSVSCPAIYRVNDGWLVDNGGPGVFMDRTSEDF